MHKGAFCLFPFQWTYYCHSSKSTGKETGRTHLCALNFKNWMFSISIFKKKPNSYILFLTLPWKMYRGNGWTIIQIQCDFRIGSLHYLILQKKKCFTFSTLIMDYFEMNWIILKTLCFQWLFWQKTKTLQRRRAASSKKMGGGAQ